MKQASNRTSLLQIDTQKCQSVVKELCDDYLDKFSGPLLDRIFLCAYISSHQDLACWKIHGLGK